MASVGWSLVLNLPAYRVASKKTAAKERAFAISKETNMAQIACLGVLFAGLLATEEPQTEVLIRLPGEVLKQSRLAEAALLASEAHAKDPAALQPAGCRA